MGAENADKDSKRGKTMQALFCGGSLPAPGSAPEAQAARVAVAQEHAERGKGVGQRNGREKGQRQEEEQGVEQREEDDEERN